MLHFAWQNLQSSMIFLLIIIFFIIIHLHFRKQLYPLPFFYQNFEELSNLHLILNHHQIIEPFSFSVVVQQSIHHLKLIIHFYCLNYFKFVYFIQFFMFIWLNFWFIIICYLLFNIIDHQNNPNINFLIKCLIMNFMILIY